MPVVNEYIYQTEIRLTANFQVGSVNTDPTTVTLKIKKPDATVLTFTYAAAQVIKDSVGNYHYDYMPPTIAVDPSAVGKYRWRWDGTGAVKASGEGEFKVIRSKVI